MEQKFINKSYNENPVIREQVIQRMEQDVYEEIGDDAYRTAFMPCLPLGEKNKK